MVVRHTEADITHMLQQLQNMSDMLWDIGSSVDSLAIGRIPPYLIPLSLVQNILTTVTRDIVTPLQAYLAYSCVCQFMSTLKIGR